MATPGQREFPREAEGRGRVKEGDTVRVRRQAPSLPKSKEGDTARAPQESLLRETRSPVFSTSLP